MPRKGKKGASVQVPLPEGCAFTLEELESCVKVLKALSSHPEDAYARQKAFKRVRGATLHLAKHLEKDHFDGKSQKEWVMAKVKAQTEEFRKSRDKRMKAFDKAHINTRMLRANRIEALNNMTEQNNLALLLGPEAPRLLKAPAEASTEKRPREAAGGAEAGQPQEKKAKDASAAVADSPAAAKPARAKSTVVVEDGDDSEDEELHRASAERRRAAEELIHQFREGNSKAEQELAEDLKAKGELSLPRSCYTCKKRFQKLHHFYDQLCPACAELNWTKRNQVANLKGKVALLTGSRVKIGFYCGLKLLRCGATVICTTRFPHDAAKRYAAEKDYAEWSDRLHLYGLDLRDLQAVNRFCLQLAKDFHRLDIIVNNAAQTIRRPPAYYHHLMEDELKRRDELPKRLQNVVKGDAHFVPNTTIRVGQAGPGGAQRTIQGIKNGKALESHPHTMLEVLSDEDSGDEKMTAANAQEESTSSSSSAVAAAAPALEARQGPPSAALLSQMAVAPGDEQHDQRLFPEGKRDVTGQQLDLRRINSWLLLLDQVQPAELVEVFAINALAPFIINSRLKRLMRMAPEDEPKFIINVSAMEGKFYRHKGPQHPHTNMAKAALNMMTRTSAQDYARDKIYMNSVDTGWINDENPLEKTLEIFNTNFQTPIDEEDAMARVLDPVLEGYNKKDQEQPHGQFYKDFNITEW